MTRIPPPALRRHLARLAVVATAAMSGLLVGFGSAQAVTTHRVLDDTRPVGAAPVDAPFPIEYFGLVGDLPSASAHLPQAGPAPFGQVRFRTNGVWGPWRALGQDGAQAPGQFSAALLPVHRAQAYQVRGLPSLGHNWRGAAINITDGPTVVTGHQPAGAAAAATNPSCMSRADWGADESITGWAKGTDTPVYYPAQVITLHHTATSNTPGAGGWPGEVRAIYTYHVQTNGWSDIGYQYLVDPNGVTYEGRWSGHTSRSCVNDNGDGSDFAHRTSDDYVVTGAHVANYNSGNVGVALLGCYDPSGCASMGLTAASPTQASLTTIDDLLMRLSVRHHLDPAQLNTSYVNPVSGATRTIPTISGHRDWDATACPGDNLYTLLPTIRSDVANTVTNAPPPTGLTATATSSTAVALSWAGTAGATGYRIERMASPSSPSSSWSTAASVPASQTAYDDTGLVPSTVYDYRVWATYSSGASTVSSTARTSTPAGSTPPPAAPAAPVLSAAATSATSVHLSWTQPSTGGVPDRYELDRRLSGGSWSAVATGLAGTTTSYDDTAVSAATTYDYRVIAANSAGSATSNTATVTTPQAPITLSVVAQARHGSWQAHLTWTAGTAPYAVWRSDVTAAPVASNVKKTTWNDTHVSAGTTYTYQVRDRTGAWSNTASVTIP